MSSLSQFDISQKTKQSRQDIFVSLKDTLSLGLIEFAKSLAHVFELGTGSKHQITKTLARWERGLQRRRRM